MQFDSSAMSLRAITAHSSLLNMPKRIAHSSICLAHCDKIIMPRGARVCNGSDDGPSVAISWLRTCFQFALVCNTNQRPFAAVCARVCVYACMCYVLCYACACAVHAIPQPVLQITSNLSLCFRPFVWFQFGGTVGFTNGIDGAQQQQHMHHMYIA